MSSRQMMLGLGFVLGAVLLSAVPILSIQSGPKAGAALAQTAADHPASFTGSLLDVPSLDRLSVRQAVYVPAYSLIRLGSGKAKVELATTLSISNVSEDKPLVVLRADYFDTSGDLIHRYVPEPIAVRPLGSVEAFVPLENTRGGTGANFVVEWAAETPIAEPLIEAVMIGGQGTQGYSFVSRGKPMTVAQPLR